MDWLSSPQWGVEAEGGTCSLHRASPWGSGEGREDRGEGGQGRGRGGEGREDRGEGGEGMGREGGQGRGREEERGTAGREGGGGKGGKRGKDGREGRVRPLLNKCMYILCVCCQC